MKSSSAGFPDPKGVCHSNRPVGLGFVQRVVRRKRRGRVRMKGSLLGPCIEMNAVHFAKTLAVEIRWFLEQFASSLFQRFVYSDKLAYVSRLAIVVTYLSTCHSSTRRCSMSSCVVNPAPQSKSPKSPKNRHSISAQVCRSRGSRHVEVSSSAPLSLGRMKFSEHPRCSG